MEPMWRLPCVQNQRRPRTGQDGWADAERNDQCAVAFERPGFTDAARGAIARDQEGEDVQEYARY